MGKDVVSGVADGVVAVGGVWVGVAGGVWDGDAEGAAVAPAVA